MSMDRKYLIAAMVYALVGLALGIYMASSHNHGHRVTHAHILLIGFVLSFFYGLIHKLWIARPGKLVNLAQFAFHQFGAAVLLAGLFLLYGNILPESMIGPLMGAASVCVLIGMALMMAMVLNNPEKPEAPEALKGADTA